MTSPLHTLAVQTLDGTVTTLGHWRGQALLVVNVASQCGLTPQYAGLQALHTRFHARGLTVLGVPCNDFAGQEPGSAAQIRSFCDSTYAVGFPMLATLRINSTPRDPLYAALIAAQPHATPSGSTQLRDALALHHLLPKDTSDVLWNFEKFLVGRDGQVCARFAPDVAPDDVRLIAAIEHALG